MWARKRSRDCYILALISDRRKKHREQTGGGANEHSCKVKTRTKKRDQGRAPSKTYKYRTQANKHGNRRDEGQWMGTIIFQRVRTSDNCGRKTEQSDDEHRSPKIPGAPKRS